MNFQSKLLVVMLFSCVLFTLTCVSATDNNTEMLSDDGDFHPFTELKQSISEAEGELNLTCDYKYDEGYITVRKLSEFTINGNDHVIDGLNDSDAIRFYSNRAVTVNNITFQNCVNASLDIMTPVIFNNVRFINCSAKDHEGFVMNSANVIFNNCTFEMNDGDYFAVYLMADCTLINNSLFNGGCLDHGFVAANRASLYVENSTFSNAFSKMATAINYKGLNLTVKRSKFINLHASLSAGAILCKYFAKENDGYDSFIPSDPFLIEGCEFINVSSQIDGGAVYFDLDSASEHLTKTLNFFNNNITGCKSKYGAGLVSLGGIINICNSTFKDNYAGFEGGATYTSWAHVNLINSTISNNTAEISAGAIYFDKGKLTITDSNLTDNRAVKQLDKTANAIYASDVEAVFSNSTFENGGIGVYANFAKDYTMENITGGDTFSMNNTDYIVSVENKGIALTFINNSIAVEDLPSRFDLREWGWVSPPRTQGDNDDCWAFATIASIESSLLKATGELYNLSQNYVQKLQLKYYSIGDLRISLTGFAYSGLGYALSWYGVLPADSGYDDRGMILDTDFDDERIHVQDAMIILGERADTINLIKEAILKYGAVSVQKILSYDLPPFNTTGEDIAVMDHGIHFVSIIGWKDSQSQPKGNDSNESSVEAYG